MPRIVLSAFLLLPQAVFAQKALAVVMYASGERTHIQNGQSVDLEPQDLIRAGDEIETGADGKVSVQCSSGVIFQIGPGSHVQVTDLVSGASAESVFVRLNAGSLSSVVNRDNGAQSVEIRTPTAVANVRGTEFVVEAEEDETSILVQEGEVEVQDASGNKAKARAGRFVRAHRRDKIREDALDEMKRRRLEVIAEVRARRDVRFKERVERLRNVKERIKNKRDRIKNLREARRQNLRDKRDALPGRPADRKERDKPERNPR